LGTRDTAWVRDVHHVWGFRFQDDSLVEATISTHGCIFSISS
jgi:hypothetical protein